VRGKLDTREVTAPSGTTWRVHRTWVRGYGPRFEGRLRRAWDVTPGNFASQLGQGFDVGDSAAAAIAVIVALVIAVFVIVPLLLFGIELIAIGAAIAVGALGRLFLGRPWIVVAQSLDGPGVGFAWKVCGIRRSPRVIDEVARALGAGEEPQPGVPAERIALPRRAD
jgi:hypothetical protein